MRCSLPAHDSPGAASGSGDVSTEPAGHLQTNVESVSVHRAEGAQKLRRGLSHGLEAANNKTAMQSSKHL